MAKVLKSLALAYLETSPGDGSQWNPDNPDNPRWLLAGEQSDGFEELEVAVGLNVTPLYATATNHLNSAKTRRHKQEGGPVWF